MGFLNSILNFVVELCETGAKNIDKKSDEELEDMSFKKAVRSGNINDYKTAYEMRDAASKAHQLYEQRKEKK